MTEGPIRDLTQLREQFITLRDALAVNDIAAVEAATESLRATLGAFSPGDAISPETRQILHDVDALSGEVADVLASRLRAFDLIIDALRAQESANS